MCLCNTDSEIHYYHLTLMQRTFLTQWFVIWKWSCQVARLESDLSEHRICSPWCSLASCLLYFQSVIFLAACVRLWVLCKLWLFFFYRTQLLRLFRNGWRATICGAKLKTTYDISIKKSCFFLLQLNYLIDYYVVVPSFTPLGSDCSELFLRPGSEGWRK